MAFEMAECSVDELVASTVVEMVVEMAALMDLDLAG